MLPKRIKPALLVLCINCKKTHLVRLRSVGDLDKWQKGMTMDRALPYLNVDQRELLISQICGKCYDSFFDDVDDDEPPFYIANPNQQPLDDDDDDDEPSIADQIIDGLMCQVCGVYMDDLESPGFPRSCKDCGGVE